MDEDAVLNKRYRLLDRIGQGGMAVVYKAEDTLLGRLVAVKVLRERYSHDDAFLTRFQREARAAASLSHPNVVGVYDIGHDGQQHYLVMEYVEGRTLKALLADEGPLSVRRTLDLAIQICAGVAHAHRAGIVHRDLKSGNVLVSPEDRAMVADFGIARALGSAPVTETGVVWGTAHYLSPEQVGGETAAPASDVYALGVILYEMLVGSVPFRADDRISVALKHLHEKPRPLHQINPHVPTRLERIVMRALAKDPGERFATAKKLSHALEEYQELSATMTAPRQAVQNASSSGTAEAAAPEGESVGFDWLALVLGIVALLAVFGLVPLWNRVYARYASSPTPTVIARVEVPQLTGLEQQEARRRIEDRGLKFEVKGTRPHPEAPISTVIGQDVLSGAMVAPRTTVGVVVSSGPALVAVPRVIDRRLEEAKRQLNDLEFVVETVEEWSAGVPAGQVLRQDPEAGESVQEGTTVKLVISSGRWISLGSNLGDQVLLVEAELDKGVLQPGETLRLRLHWQALTALDQSYKVFVHLTEEDGTILAQQDQVPVGGARPTTTWTKGVRIEDPYELAVPQGARTGTYEIRVGMYHPETLERLSVRAGGEAKVADNSVILKEVHVLAR